MLKDLHMRIGVMGGMFDPVHNGHLQLAQQVKQECQLDEIRLLPCGHPVHRNISVAAAEHRIRMLDLAAENHAWLKVDRRECNKAEPSYAYDTLAGIGAECPQAALFFILGADAFLSLDTWYRWRELTLLAHLIVASRPGYLLDDEMRNAGFMSAVSKQVTYSVADTIGVTAGRILLLDLSTPEVSSTQVRSAIFKGTNPEKLLDPAVLDYIKANKLYQ